MSDMQVTYSRLADTAYIRLRSHRGQVRAHEVAPGILIDVDDQGDAVGIEVLGLQRRGLAVGRVDVRVDPDSPPGRETADERRLRLAVAAAAEPPTAATG